FCVACKDTHPLGQHTHQGVANFAAALAAPQPQGGALTPAAFTDWLASEMPAGTVIGNPFWWAPKIYATAIASTPPAPQ
ncbi:hypothetical protein ABTK03_21760, partial [Acinetobacter baumannii]